MENIEIKEVIIDESMIGTAVDEIDKKEEIWDQDMIDEYFLVLDPSDINIIGADNEDNIFLNVLLIKGDENLDTESEVLPAILQLNRDEYFYLMNEWLDAKADFSERFKHFCGVGQFYIDDLIYLNEGKLNIFNEENEDIKEIPAPIIMLNDVEESELDFEHG